MKNIFKKASRLALTAPLLLTAACSSTTADSTENEWPDTFVVTTSLDETNPDSDALNEQFAEDMSEALGIDVEIYSASSYTTIVEGMAAGTVNATLCSPMSYFQITEKMDVDIAASAQMAYDYYSVIITQGDNDEINSLEDLEGKTFAFVDQASSSGYLYPKAYLIQELGLDSDQLETSGYFFDTVAFSGGHNTSLTGVVMGDYDAACVAAQVVQMMVEAGQIEEDDVKVIGQTDIIPNPCYVIDASLPDDLKTAFKEFLLNYDNEEFFEAALGSADMSFGEGSEEDYEPTKQVIELLGLEFGD